MLSFNPKSAIRNPKWHDPKWNTHTTKRL